MALLCECLTDHDIFLGCRQDKNGRLDESVALYLTKEKRLRVVYPTPELARHGRLWESGQFEVCIEHCPICGRRLKGWKNNNEK